MRWRSCSALQVRIGCLAGLLFIGCIAARAGDSIQELQRAKSLYEDGSAAAAEKAFGALALSDPAYAARAGFGITLCKLQVGNIDDAMTEFDSALRSAEFPRDRQEYRDAAMKLARAEITARLWDESLRLIQGLTRESPEDANWLLVDYHMKRADYPSASEVLRDLLARYPGSGSVTTYVVCLAECTAYQGKPEDACAYLERAIADHPNDRTVLSQGAYLLTELLEVMRKPTEARAWYTRLIAEHPTDAEMVGWRYRLSRLSYRAGDWAAAREAMEALYGQYPVGQWHGAIKLCIGDCCVRLGDHATALQAFDEIVRDFPRETAARAARDYAEHLRQGGGQTNDGAR